jgi:hypothetical protein
LAQIGLFRQADQESHVSVRAEFRKGFIKHAHVCCIILPWTRYKIECYSNDFTRVVTSRVLSFRMAISIFFIEVPVTACTSNQILGWTFHLQAQDRLDMGTQITLCDMNHARMWIWICFKHKYVKLIHPLHALVWTSFSEWRVDVA